MTTAIDQVGRDDPRRRPTARPGAFVRISVSDTGPAVDPDRLVHAFEPFYALEAGGWSPELGLSSVEGLVVEAGGFMTATSGGDRGSIFSVFLPLADGASPD